MELSNIYDKLVLKAENNFYKNNFDNCIKCIQSAATLQYNLNQIYSDKRLDLLLSQISLKLYVPNQEGCNNIVFFYDSFCFDNRGLTQHYLDALINNGKYKIIYVLETSSAPYGVEILQLLKKNRVTIHFLPNGTWKEKSDYLYNLICKYKPSAALFHLTPFTVIPFIAFAAFQNIIKYQINLTDHAFWLGGNGFFDYLYEFRTYGMTISLKKRGYSIKQLILNPFYPWQSDVPFQGFPISTTNKVVILSGGALYKIEGENDQYFKLVKLLLDTYSDVVFFYAGGGSAKHINSFIEENHYEKRLILLGNRTDIDALFKNCDIYMSTYPFGGGLMSQYAAINAKPILVYKSVKIEKLICTKQYRPYALNTIEEFISEAGRLIKDKHYREERGEFCKSLMINQEIFRERFNDTFMLPFSSKEKYIQDSIDYDKFCEGYVKRINNNIFGCIEVNFIKVGILSIKIVVNMVLYIPKYIKLRLNIGNNKI